MKKHVRFDLRTKIFVLIIINVLLFVSKSLVFECVLTGSSLVIVAISGHGKSAFRFALFFLFSLLLEVFAMPYLGGFFGSLLLFVVVLVRKVLPCLIIGKWILSSTEASEFVSTMWKMRLPQTVIIPISVVFRYFPTLKEEWQSLRMAMKMRGIGMSFEHIIVPLIASAVNISEELSAAALCRGLDAPDGHTCIRQICFSRHDYIVIGAFTLLVAGSIWLKTEGLL